MTIKAELQRGPRNYGLPSTFSMTGAAQSEEGAAVYVQGTKFVGSGENKGGYVELTFDRGRVDIPAGKRKKVDIIFDSKDTNKRELKVASYIVTGS